METRVKITAATGKHKIYGLLTQRSKDTKKILVVIHGLTGWAHEGKNRACVKHFVERGWAGLRVSLYGPEDDARRLVQVGISDHARDIERIIRYCRRRGFKQICLAGHSLGWPSILLADLSDVAAVVSWDGTTPDELKTLTYGRYKDAVKGYVIDWGVRFVFGRKMRKEFESFRSIPELMRGFTTPMCLIMASKCVNHPKAKDYCKYSEGPSQYILIKGASHNFEEEGKEEALIKGTFEWCQRWCT